MNSASAPVGTQREGLHGLIGDECEQFGVVARRDRLEPDDVVGERRIGRREARYAPWHFLYFLPEPHGHGSLRPTLSNSEFTFGRCATGVETAPPPPPPVA